MRLLRRRPDRESVTPEAVERVLRRLEALSLLDDRSFAGFWVENRERFRPRSARALRQELSQRGVEREIREELAQPDRDEERALLAARQHLRGAIPPDFDSFQSRLGNFLLRRGFSYDIARHVTQSLWNELRDGDAGW